MPKLLYELEKLSRTTLAPNPDASLDVARYAQPVPSSPAPSPAVIVHDPEPVQQSTITFKTFDDRRTRRSDLPPEMQAIYDACASDFKLKRGLHETMKLATTNADRASLRARILETDARIRAGWADIDAFLTRQAIEKAKADDFKEATARSYVSRALKKEKLTGAQMATLKARVQALIEHGCVIGPDTMNQLKKIGAL